jgi:very-short-patch-repair endonuclease
MTLCATHPHIAKLWHPTKNKILPSAVTFGSRKIIFWICESGHEHSMSVYHKVYGISCPECRTSTEKKLCDFLKQSYEVRWSAKFDWCKSKTTEFHLLFDFELLNFKILIELDGDQHFKDVKSWKTVADEIMLNDVYKMKCAIKNGYSVIRLKQMNVYYNKNNWQEKLTNVIKKYNLSSVIYIDDKDNYAKHKKAFDEYVEIKNDIIVKPTKVTKNKILKN